MAKWTLRREYLKAGGYTSSGTYYGNGAPLFVAMNDEPIDARQVGWMDTHTFRASSRDAAKQHVRDTYDANAKFYS